MGNSKIDITIVGGGVSGVYSAWKLKTKYPEKNIVVYEGSDQERPGHPLFFRQPSQLRSSASSSRFKG